MNQSKSALAGEHSSITHTGPVKNIVETIIGEGNLTTVAAAIKAAGLTDSLTSKGPFTVFAPTDEAFKKLPLGALDALLKDTGKLKSVLQYHVIAGHVTTRDMKSCDVVTLQGSPLTVVVSAPEVRINGAQVKNSEFIATNGVIHAIDTVIMPKNWQLKAVA